MTIVKKTQMESLKMLKNIWLAIAAKNSLVFSSYQVIKAKIILKN